MDELESDGRRLSATFDRAMTDVAPDLGPLVSGAATRGRVLRRRRRAAASGTVAAAVLLAVGGVVALTPDGRGDGGTVTAAAGAGSASGTASPLPPKEKDPGPNRYTDDGPEKVQAGTGANSGKVALTGHAAALGLVESLPRNGTFSAYEGYYSLVGWTQGERGNVLTESTLMYDDGKGPVNLRIKFEGGLGALFKPGSNPMGPGHDPSSIGYDDRYDCATITARPGPKLDRCEVTKLPDGSTLLLTELTQDRYRNRTVDLLRKDNHRITLTEMSGGIYGSPRELPHSLEQLKAAVTSGSLQEWITPERAEQANKGITPFFNNTPGRGAPGTPTASATPAGR
ncbi:hypothetical protein ACWEQL_16925 [Kitasatospora sp. NPDC004240]